jgi:uncharacterized protein
MPPAMRRLVRVLVATTVPLMACGRSADLRSEAVSPAVHSPLPSIAKTAPAERWVGRVEIHGDSFAASILPGGAESPTLRVATLDLFDPVSLRAETKGTTRRYEFEKHSGTWSKGRWTLELDATGDSMQGRVKVGEVEGTARFERVMGAPPNLGSLEGSFVAGTERFVFARMGGALLRTDRNYFDELVEVAPARGSAGIVPLRTARGDLYTFAGDVLEVETAGGRKVTASREKRPYSLQHIEVVSGAVTLRGTLRVPTGVVRPPVVVLSHGSGNAISATTMYEATSDYLARRGIAVVNYDKRGSGRSSGRWQSASFDDLADDVVAVVRHVRGAFGPRLGPIGVWGISQAGWILPIAASKESSIAFLLLASPPAVSVAAQELSRVEHEMRADGFTDLDVGEALAFVNEVVKSENTEPQRKRLLARIAGVKDKRWAKYPAVLMVPGTSEALEEGLRIVQAGQGQIANLERLSCPVLVLYGDKDQMVRVDENEPKMRKALARARTKDVTIRIFNNADHLLAPSTTGGREEFLHNFDEGREPRWVEGYLETLAAWVTKRFTDSTIASKE